MSAVSAQPRIFIAYRRDDSQGFARSIHDRLAQHFGPVAVFRDINDIEPRRPWEEAIDEALGSCDVFMLLIGSRWLDATELGVGRKRRQRFRLAHRSRGAGGHRTIDVGAGPEGITAGPDSIWVANGEANSGHPDQAVTHGSRLPSRLPVHASSHGQLPPRRIEADRQARRT